MKKILWILPAVLLVASCAREEVAVKDVVEEETALKDSGEFVPGELVVLLSDELTEMVENDLAAGNLATKSEGLNGVMSSLGVTSMERLFPDAGEYEPRTRREGLHKWYVLKFDKTRALTKAGAELEDLSGIEFVENRRKIKTDEFNDLSSTQWGFWNRTKSGFDINVRKVWEEYTAGDSNVIVAVVDGGIDLTHEDLAWNCGSTNYNFVDNNARIVSHDHGTHVAGTIGAVNNNGKGVCGVAGGDYANNKKGVTLMSCQIFEDGKSGGSGATAIKWAADNGAVIAQNSWGYDYDADGDGKLSGSELTNALAGTITSSDKAAVDYFIKYAGCDNSGNQLSSSPMKGGVVIFAAGNEGIRNGAPANYDAVVAVGAVEADGTRASYSNYGSWVDIAAPGTNIYSTYPGSKYGNMSGTSMACPHVSGVAALIVSYCGGTGFTNTQLKEKLLNSANTEILSSAYQIGGLVDALGAITYGEDAAPAAVTDLAATVTSNNVKLTWTGTSSSDGKSAYGYLVLYGKDKATVESSLFTNPSSGVGRQAFVAENSASGSKMTGTLSGLDFSTPYYIKIAAYSYGRSFSDGSGVLSATTGENHAPVITTTSTGPYSLGASDEVVIPITITEPDGHEYTTSYTSGSTADSFAKSPAGVLNITLVGKDADPGEYTAKLTATDAYGMSGTFTVTYTIRENQAPVLLDGKDIASVFLTTRGEFTIDMTQYFSDPDGDALKYDVAIADPTVAYLTAKDNSMIGTVLKYGRTSVTITASDPKGASVSSTFEVLAREKSIAYQAYPNPVSDYLYVATGESSETCSFKVVSQTGAVLKEETQDASVFSPAKLDFSSFAPGRYVLELKFGGKEYKQTIIKK